MQAVVYTASGSPGLEIEAGCDLPLGHILIRPGAEVVMDMVLSRDGDAGHDIVLEDVAVKFEGGGTESGMSYELPVRLPDRLEPDNPEDPDASRQELKLYATITAWQETPSGNITIE